MSRFQTIVAAIDFSDTAADALDAAMTLAAPVPGARVHLLHVVPDPVPALWSEELPQIDVVEIERTWREGALQQLAALAAAARLEAGRFTAAVVVGQPAAEIARYADEQGADVVVLGSHGHGLVHRFLLGSVAERVARQAPCAVLIVPHKTLRAAGQPAAEAGAAAR